MKKKTLETSYILMDCKYETVYDILQKTLEKYKCYPYRQIQYNLLGGNVLHRYYLREMQTDY